MTGVTPPMCQTTFPYLHHFATTLVWRTAPCATDATIAMYYLQGVPSSSEFSTTKMTASFEQNAHRCDRTTGWSPRKMRIPRPVGGLSAVGIDSPIAPAIHHLQ